MIHDSREALHRIVLKNAMAAEVDGKIDALDLRIEALLAERQQLRQIKQGILRTPITGLIEDRVA